MYRFFFEQEESDVILLLPTITGHIFPLLSHFIVEGSSLTSQFCPSTEQHCLYWISEEFFMSEDFMAEEIAIEENRECIPWTSERVSGCCVDLEMSPTTACADRVEMGVSLGMSVLLVFVYFVIGAGIGFVVQKRRKK